MAKYKIINDGWLDTENNMYIPNAPGNRNYQEVQEWIASGNTPDPQYTEQELSDMAWDSLRNQRDLLLKETDFMMTQDYYYSVLTAQEQTDVTTYRQALRDLPTNTADPTNITWPDKPQIIINNIS